MWLLCTANFLGNAGNLAHDESCLQFLEVFILGTYWCLVDQARDK